MNQSKIVVTCSTHHPIFVFARWREGNRLHHHFEVEPTGLEPYLAPRLFNKTIRQKQKYVSAVLVEYQRQCACSVCDIEQLASVATEKSCWSTYMKCALRVGSYQSKAGPRNFASRAA